MHNCLLARKYRPKIPLFPRLSFIYCVLSLDAESCEDMQILLKFRHYISEGGGNSFLERTDFIILSCNEP